jgi:hypothetical protein
MKCNIHFCNKVALNYDQNEQIYLCSEHIELRNIYREKGAFGAFKHHMRQKWEEIKNQYKR